MTTRIPSSQLSAVSLTLRNVSTTVGDIVAFVPVGDITLESLVHDVEGYGLSSMLKPGNTVVEVGTAFGLLPVMLSRSGVAMNYVGFEPVAFNYTATLGTMALNNVRGRVFNYAISELRNSLDFIVHPTGMGGASACVQNHTPCDHICLFDVSAMTLSSALRLAGCASVDILVLDCEGAEHEIAQALPKGLVKAVRGELHENTAIRRAGFSNAATLALLQSKVEDCKVGCIEMMDV